MSRTVLVTGATAGFGEAIAYKFAKDQNKIIITESVIGIMYQ